MLPPDVLHHTERHLGLVTRPTLLRLGHSEGAVEGWVRRGHLEIVRIAGRRLPGTYRVPGGAAPPEQEPYAAALRCRPDARVTGPFVLACLGVEGFAQTDPFAILVPTWRTLAAVPFPVLVDREREPRRAALGPVPITTATRALVDAALWVQGKPLRVAFDSARFRGLTTAARLRSCAGAAGHAGGEVVLALLDSGALDLESEGERALAPILGDLDPPPRWQHWVTPRRRVDCMLVDVPLIVEYLGEVAHGGVDQRRDDDLRDHELRSLGYHIEYVVKDDLKRPDVLRARILGLRAGLLAARAAGAARAG